MFVNALLSTGAYVKITFKQEDSDSEAIICIDTKFKLSVYPTVIET